jgi:hypothetical protein
MGAMRRLHVSGCDNVAKRPLLQAAADPPLWKRSGERLLQKAVHEFSWPLIHNGSEAQQRSADATLGFFIGSSPRR